MHLKDFFSLFLYVPHSFNQSWPLPTWMLQRKNNLPSFPGISSVRHSSSFGSERWLYLSTSTYLQREKLRLSISVEPVSFLKTQPQITFHVRPLTYSFIGPPVKPMHGQQLNTPFPISTELFCFIFFTIESILLCKPKETLSWILESHHVMKYPPEHLMCEKCLSSVMTCSLLHLVLHNAKQTKCAYLDGNHRSVISLLSFGDVFFPFLPFFTSGQLAKKLSISIFFNEPPISQVPGCSIPVVFFHKVLR